jgi:CDP-paratose 2-epimerase
MRLLITGVCGFVGSTLAECLLERAEGIRVAGMDNLIRPGAETNRARIERLGVEFIHGDLRSASDIAGLPACEWVIDAAANPSVCQSQRVGRPFRRRKQPPTLRT